MSVLATMRRNYSTEFYDSQGGESARSAAAMVPYIMDVLAPHTVLDVGCGIGPWVKAFAEAGTASAHGLDGPWAREGGLLIGESNFCEFDFTSHAPPFRPAGLLDRYDLLTTFEFVEHLGSNEAGSLADFFCSKSDAIIIGCAIPGQGGSHHVNEQWPSYWAGLMAERGYVACDFIRPAIWTDERIMPWYRQNSIGYFRGQVPPEVLERAIKEWTRAASQPLSIVHPSIFTGKCETGSPNVGNLMQMASMLARKSVKSWIGRS